MNHYQRNPKDLAVDAKAFLDSTYAKEHIMPTLKAMSDGFLSAANDMRHPYPERYLAKHSAVKEVIELFQPLEDA